jgi:hypothetical protein
MLAFDQAWLVVKEENPSQPPPDWDESDEINPETGLPWGWLRRKEPNFKERFGPVGPRGPRDEAGEFTDDVGVPFKIPKPDPTGKTPDERTKRLFGRVARPIGQERVDAAERETPGLKVEDEDWDQLLPLSAYDDEDEDEDKNVKTSLDVAFDGAWGLIKQITYA